MWIWTWPISDIIENIGRVVPHCDRPAGLWRRLLHTELFWYIMMKRFSILVGDITHSHADAIVNAANVTLLGGSGVDGAIHAAAGPELLAECRTLGGCETGQARLTAGYRLPAKHVLHTPGPIWRGGGQGEAALLASCYRSCLTLAEAHGLQSVDFSSISTGVYGYPLPQAATVALKAIMDFLAEHDTPQQVRMICHTRAAAEVYQQVWNQWYAESKTDRIEIGYL